MNADPGAVTSNVAIESARDFLARFAPFDGIAADTLARLASRLSLGYYPKKTVLIAAGAEVDTLYIVQRGAVQRTGALSSPSALEEGGVLGPGEIFPLEAVLRTRRTDASFEALADTFCYLLAGADFMAAMGASERLRAYALDHFAALLKDAQRALVVATASRAQDEQILSRPLRDLLRRAPVQCSPHTPIETALALMHSARVGSVLVVDADERLCGILTRHDVLDRIALARRSLAEPVSAVMTPRPHFLSADASAYEAASLIAREGFRHVPVVEAGKPIGVVTERDLFALQHASLRGVRRAIRESASIASLAAAAGEVRAAARRMHELGVQPAPLTHIVTTLNDAIATRAIEIESVVRAPPAVAWCWLAFGAEGRCEQTVSTDQDNGIVFDGPGAEQAHACAALIEFAGRVNRALDACGFPLCKGGIMAGNPRWCMSVADWEAAFAGWIEVPQPQELLNAVIFFDFRALYGDERLAARLRAGLAQRVGARPAFLRHLAAFAVETRPPLGLLGGFADDDPHQPGTLDLKRSAARFFVDGARVLALAAGVADTNTAARLAAAGARLGLSEHELRSAIDAFWFVQGLRYRVQLAGGDASAPNRIALRSLSDLEARMLKECLRQARSLQARIALDYRL